MGFTGGDAGVLRIEGMGYYDPDIVTFYGSDPTGSKTQLVQHVSQLNVMLRDLAQSVEQAEPNRIGFRSGRKTWMRPKSRTQMRKPNVLLADRAYSACCAALTW